MSSTPSPSAAEDARPSLGERSRRVLLARVAHARVSVCSHARSCYDGLVKLAVALSLSLVGCATAPRERAAPPPPPQPVASGPSPRPTTSASLVADWETAPLLQLPEGAYTATLDGPTAPRDVLFEDVGCGPVALASAGDAAFVLCNRQGEVLRVDADKQSRVLYRNETPFTLAVAAGAQVFAAQANGGLLVTIPQSGGPFRVLTRGIDAPQALAADGEAAFVVSQQRLLRITRAGDERVVARTATVISSLTARAGEVAFADLLPSTARGPSRSVVLRVRGVGEPALVAAFDDNVDRLTADDRALYVHLAQRRELVRLPNVGAPSVVSRTSGILAGPLSDGRHVYWVDSPEGRPLVLRAKVEGGAAEALGKLEPTEAIQQLALTEHHVLALVTGASNVVLRLPK